MKLGSITALPGATESFSLEILDGQTIYIGRSAKACGNVEANRLILPYSEVSAKHAEIRCRDNKLTIVDAGSTNGTTVNGVRLTPGKEYNLKSKDTIGIANYNLLVSLSEELTANQALQFLVEEPQTEQAKTQFQVKLIYATILVCDLKHYTSLMEEHADDPSVVMKAAGRVFTHLNEEIEKNNGQLEKIAGDAIMAYWSSKGAQAEAAASAQKACLAALNMQHITQKIANNVKIWPFKDHKLAFDIALASGPVASGALGKSQGNPALLGDTANLVFRLEKLIGDDQYERIIVDENTYLLVKEHFDFKFLGEQTIKGRLNFVNVYALLASRGSAYE